MFFEMFKKILIKCWNKNSPFAVCNVANLSLRVGIFDGYG